MGGPTASNFEKFDGHFHKEEALLHHVPHSQCGQQGHRAAVDPDFPGEWHHWLETTANHPIKLSTLNLQL